MLPIVLVLLPIAYLAVAVLVASRIEHVLTSRSLESVETTVWPQVICEATLWPWEVVSWTLDIRGVRRHNRRTAYLRGYLAARNTLDEFALARTNSHAPLTELERLVLRERLAEAEGAGDPYAPTSRSFAKGFNAGVNEFVTAAAGQAPEPLCAPSTSTPDPEWLSDDSRARDRVH